jgi:hypothetical protein
VTCDAIRATGLSAGLALDETDIELMGLEELELCVDTLGSLELDNKVQRKILSLINKVSLCFVRCASCIYVFCLFVCLFVCSFIMVQDNSLIIMEDFLCFCVV